MILFCVNICVFEADGEELGCAGCVHGDAIEDACARHRLAVVGDDDKLRILGKVLEHVAILAGIGFIESSIGLVEDEEWRRIDLRNSE